MAQRIISIHMQCKLIQLTFFRLLVDLKQSRILTAVIHAKEEEKYSSLITFFSPSWCFYFEIQV